MIPGLRQKESKRDEPTPEERAELRQEENQQRAATESGLRRAERQDELVDMRPEDILGVLQDPDIKSDGHPELEEYLKPYLSGQHVTSYREEDNRKSIEVGNWFLADWILASRRHGRLCTGPFLEVAQRVHGRPDKPVKPRPSPDEEMAIRTAIEDVRTEMQYLAIDGFGLSKVADTHIETKNLNVSEGDSGGGRISKGLNKVFG